MYNEGYANGAAVLLRPVCRSSTSLYIIASSGRTLREVLFTSRRLFCRARRVGKTTPGLFGKAHHKLQTLFLTTRSHPQLQ